MNEREIRKIVDTAYERALTTIRENEDKLHVMVALLFQHETIYGDEVDLIMEGKTVEEITAYIEDKKAKREAEAKAKAEETRAKENPLCNPKDFIVNEAPVITVSEPIILDGKVEEVNEELSTQTTEEQVEEKVDDTTSNDEPTDN